MTATGLMRAPQQARSVATLRAIEAASLELLAAGGWDNVTVSGIERIVGISRGAFYARFPSRAALLDFVRDQYHSALNLAEQQAFRQVDTTSPDLTIVVSGAVDAVAEIVDRFGSIMARLRDDPAERQSSGLARSILFDRYRQAVLGVSGAIAREDPEAAVAFTFRVVFESLAFSVGDPQTVPLPLRCEPTAFRAELVAMVVAYLTASP